MRRFGARANAYVFTNPAERCGERFNIGDKDLELALEAGLEHAVVVLDNENPLHSYKLFPTVQLPRMLFPGGL